MYEIQKDQSVPVKFFAGEAAEEVVVYLTGEFFADAITLPEGVTADTLAKAFRNIGIFLK